MRILGRKAKKALVKAPTKPVEPSVDDLRLRLRALRAEHRAIDARLAQIDREVLKVAKQIEELEKADRK